MKHAGPAALDRLEPLLARIRALGLFKEKTRGTFYLRNRAALHFHEDPSGLHADLRLMGDEFERLKIEAPDQQEALIGRLKALN